MFSPSDYNDAVPQFTNGNYAPARRRYCAGKRLLCAHPSDSERGEGLSSGGAGGCFHVSAFSHRSGG